MQRSDGAVSYTHLDVYKRQILANSKLKLIDYAKLLDKQAWDPAASATGTALDWAEESCKLIDAKGIYPPDDQHKMDHVYLDNMRPLAEQRVHLAAERLATLLNQTLGK